MIRSVAPLMLLAAGISAERPIAYMTDGPNPRLQYAVSAPAEGQPSSQLNGTAFDNCVQVTPNLNFHWAIRDGMFKAATEGFAPENYYFAFGVIDPEIEDNVNLMLGGDAIVTYYDNDNDEAFAVDYDINGISECRNGQGVCPDEQVENGVNDVFNVSGYYQDGIMVVSFVRPLETMDINDLEVMDNALFFLFAQGEMNDDGYPTNHGPERRGAVEIQLGRRESRCNVLLPNQELPGSASDSESQDSDSSASALSTGAAGLLAALSAVAYFL